MKRIALASIFGSLMVAGQALAAFSIDDLHNASKMATNAFAAANPDHAQHFSGYKAWLSGDESKVKIYVNHDGMNMEFNYLCHKHDGGIECHAQ